MARILLAESVRSHLVTEAEVAAPAETGGILLGVHVRSGVWVTHAVHLPGASSHGRFQVPKGVTTSSVEHARDTIDPRLGYAGGWHSHPAGDGPSATDRSTMRVLSYWTRRPPRGGIVLLVRRTRLSFTVDGYRARFPVLHSTLVLITGELE